MKAFKYLLISTLFLFLFCSNILAGDTPEGMPSYNRINDDKYEDTPWIDVDMAPADDDYPYIENSDENRLQENTTNNLINFTIDIATIYIKIIIHCDTNIPPSIE